MSEWTPQPSDRPSGHRSELVLLIDDDAGIRNVFQEVLHHHGYQVQTAATVEEAETIKQRLGVKAIGLVIADIHLTTNPRLHEGYTLYEAWSHVHPTIPFLLISGISNSQLLPAIHAGTVPFLAKPFTMEAFLTRIQQLLKVPNTPPGMSVE